MISSNANNSSNAGLANFNSNNAVSNSNGNNGFRICVILLIIFYIFKKFGV